MNRNLLPKLSAFLLAILLFESSCNKTVDKNTGSSGETNDNISLTTPVGYSGNVPESADPDPTPQVSDVYAPFVGVWQDEHRTFVFLPDGRVAFKEERDGKTSADVGICFKTNDPRFFDFVWRYSDKESFYVAVSDNNITCDTYNYPRVGDAGSAQSAYDDIYNFLKASAVENSAKFPVGPVSASQADENDPNPNNVISGAKVFTTGIHFQNSFKSDGWYDMPDGTVEGFDGYSRTDVWLMPNGRFFMQLWLWDGVNPQNKMESYTHQHSWGKYTVIKGTDVMTGDIINFYYDNGGTAAYRTVGGQSCFLTKNIIYHQK